MGEYYKDEHPKSGQNENDWDLGFNDEEEADNRDPWGRGQTGNGDGGGGGGGGGGMWGGGGDRGGYGGGSGDPWGRGYGYYQDDDSGSGSGSGSGEEEDDDGWHLCSVTYKLKMNGKEILLDGNGFMLTCDKVFLTTQKSCIDITVECQIEDDDKGEHADCILLKIVPDETKNVGQSVGVSAVLNLYGKWQLGHYDYSKLNRARFRVQNDDENITPWYTLLLGSQYVKICTIVLKNGLIKIERC